jgi:hypothetical protein
MEFSVSTDFSAGIFSNFGYKSVALDKFFHPGCANSSLFVLSVLGTWFYSQN